MQLRIEITDEHRPYAIAVSHQAEAWPEFLNTFLSAILAAQFVAGRVAVYNEAIKQLTEQRNALAGYVE